MSRMRITLLCSSSKDSAFGIRLHSLHIRFFYFSSFLFSRFLSAVSFRFFWWVKYKKSIIEIDTHKMCVCVCECMSVCLLRLVFECICKKAYVKNGNVREPMQRNVKRYRLAAIFVWVRFAQYVFMYSEFPISTPPFAPLSTFFANQYLYIEWWYL